MRLPASGGIACDDSDRFFQPNIPETPVSFAATGPAGRCGALSFLVIVRVAASWLHAFSR